MKVLLNEEAMHMLKGLKKHLDHIMANDPAARNYIEVILLYPSVHAVGAYKISHWCYTHRFFFMARLISQVSRFFTGIEIHPGAQIDECLFIDHGMGVVIGETTVIGKRVTIYQGTTLGGTGKDIGKRHPTIGDDVVIGAGARILGPIHIAAGTKIGAGSVVLKDTKTESTAVGIPARIIGGIDKSVIPIDRIKDKAQPMGAEIYNDMII